MNLLAAFSKRAPFKVLLSMVLGICAGIVYSLLIPLVLGALGEDRSLEAPAALVAFTMPNVHPAGLFAAACALILLARTLSQVMLSRVAIDVAADLRRQTYDRILQAPLAALERIGHARLLTALHTDVPRIVAGGRLLPDLLVSAVTVAGMLSFLMVLNLDAFGLVLGCIVFGAITYQVPMYVARKYFQRARLNADGLQQAIHGLIRGVKELKLSELKRRTYVDSVLSAYESDMMRAEKAGNTVMRAAMNYGDLLGFCVIGVVAFVFARYVQISRQELVGVIMALLYVTGPVAVILNFIPQLTVARISLGNMMRLFAEMPREHVDLIIAPCKQWRELSLKQVSYRYADKDGSDCFELGPIDLKIVRGEITIIAGSNGSGKSTLAKLVTLHYWPHTGTIRFDQSAVDPQNVSSWRESIGAIYSDYHLFERLLERVESAAEDGVQHYLRALQLDRKVSCVDGRFSTLDLSDGQRRRLALVVTCIEDRELLLFDEWTADQDPIFKKFFYCEILPALRVLDKALVVITYDDRYIGVADQIVRMEGGRIMRIDRPNG